MTRRGSLGCRLAFPCVRHQHLTRWPQSPTLAVGALQGRHGEGAWRAVLGAAPRTVLLCSRSGGDCAAVLTHLAAALIRVADGLQDAEQARQEIVSLCAACLAARQQAAESATSAIDAALAAVTQQAFLLLAQLARADPSPRKLWAAAWGRLMPVVLAAQNCCGSAQGGRAAEGGSSAATSIWTAMSAVLARPWHGLGMSEHFQLPGAPALAAQDSSNGDSAPLAATSHAADILAPFTAAFPSELPVPAESSAAAGSKPPKRKRGVAQSALTAAEMQRVRESLPTYAAWLVAEAARACKQAAGAPAGDTDTDTPAQHDQLATAPMGLVWALLHPALLVMRAASEKLAAPRQHGGSHHSAGPSKRARQAADPSDPRSDADKLLCEPEQAWVCAAAICSALLRAASEHQVQSPRACDLERNACKGWAVGLAVTFAIV